MSAKPGDVTNGWKIRQESQSYGWCSAIRWLPVVMGDEGVFEDTNLRGKTHVKCLASSPNTLERSVQHQSSYDEEHRMNTSHRSAKDTHSRSLALESIAYEAGAGAGENASKLRLHIYIPMKRAKPLAGSLRQTLAPSLRFSSPSQVTL